MKLETQRKLAASALGFTIGLIASTGVALATIVVTADTLGPTLAIVLGSVAFAGQLATWSLILGDDDE